MRLAAIRRRAILFMALVPLQCGLQAAPAATGAASACNLKTEGLVNPIGLDEAAPHLSWQINDSRPGAVQTACRIMVATSPGPLAEFRPDVWDSGRRETSSTQNQVYAGPPLRPGTRYCWAVQVWDKEGKPGAVSEPGFWDTGILDPAKWQAQWIAARPSQSPPPRLPGTASWIWVAGEKGNEKASTDPRYFRTHFEIPQAARDKATTRVLHIAVDDTASVYLNGHFLGRPNGWKTFAELPLSSNCLSTGTNTLAVECRNTQPGPGGLLAAVVTVVDGESTAVCVTGRSWVSSPSVQKDWKLRECDETVWKPAEILGDAGMAPWGMPAASSSGGPAALLRKEFAVAKPVRRAHARATALGSYQLFINGRRVGSDALTPDWTDFRKRAICQTYDVTDMVQEGRNAIGAILGDGWYASPLGWVHQRNGFGPPPNRLLAQLTVECADGTSETVGTDSTWKCAASPIQQSEIYDGEIYDARHEEPGWDTAGFNDASWSGALPAPPAGRIAVDAQESPTIRVTESLDPVTTKTVGEGLCIVDMGQNLAGWARITVQGESGDEIRLRFAEILSPDGSIYRENLRSAEATDVYVLRGGGPETFEPHFTYHGFRYIELSGPPEVVKSARITALAAHTAVPPTAEFHCSSDLVNRVWKATTWGIRSNLMSVPTDCPQRDERLGWTGDAQAIWGTACYAFDMAPFTAKWMRDMRDAQSPEGGFPDVAPRIIADGNGAPAWGDAGVIVPWTAYRRYGDTRIIDDNWQAMERWMEFIRGQNPDHLRLKGRGNDYGDWVGFDETTPKDLIATAFWALDAKYMAEMAKATGRTQRAEAYRELFGKIRAAFIGRFVTASGKVGSGSQTCQILALNTGLVPDDLRSSATTVLTDDIRQRGTLLSTGFLGTVWLMPVLTENGANDLAYALLLQDKCPSWGYMIRKGATTIWERWNGDRGDPGMNSFNHYAFGCVCEWLFKYAAGIDQPSDDAGFGRIRIKPHPGPGIDQMKASYQSVHGRIASQWETTGGQLMLTATIPPNTTAEVHVPMPKGGAAAITAPPEARFVREEGDRAVYAVAPGVWSFGAPWKQ